ncbi:hypothetical protein F4801DRAFT_572640 [Xylaria longipes]|nr:hypothetical protein F4801DRAFT_572640 [Xylaria longipes]
MEVFVSIFTLGRVIFMITIFVVYGVYLQLILLFCYVDIVFFVIFVVFFVVYLRCGAWVGVQRDTAIGHCSILYSIILFEFGIFFGEDHALLQLFLHELCIRHCRGLLIPCECLYVTRR